jgi:hypothetical protein
MPPMPTLALTVALALDGPRRFRRLAGFTPHMTCRAFNI